MWYFSLWLLHIDICTLVNHGVSFMFTMLISIKITKLLSYKMLFHFNLINLDLGIVNIKYVVVCINIKIDIDLSDMSPNGHFNFKC